MTATDAILALCLLPLMAASAFCSAAETALFSLTHADRARLKRTHRHAWSTVSALLARPRTLLISLLLLNNAANLTYFVIASIIGRHNESAWVVFALGVASLVGLLLLAEVVPKILARRNRVLVSRLLAPPLLIAVRAVAPLRAFFEIAFIAPFARLLSPARTGPPPAVSPEELGALLEVSARGGDIDPNEQRLLSEVVELGSIRVRDVMTPRIDLRWLPDSAGRAQVLEAVRLSGRDELPLCRGGLDGTVLGLLDARSFLAAAETSGPGRPAEARTADHVRPVIYFPERARLDQLLAEFRTSRRRTAVCVDEYGAIVGIVTLDHILLRLLASGTPDLEAPQEQARRLGPDSWLIPGRLPIRDLAEFFSGPAVRSTRDGSVATAAGLVLLTLGRLPTVGDAVTVGNLRLKVESMRGRMIETILVSIADRRSVAAPRGATR